MHIQEIEEDHKDQIESKANLSDNSQDFSEFGDFGIKEPTSPTKKKVKKSLKECKHHHHKTTLTQPNKKDSMNDVDYIQKFKNKQLRRAMAHTLGDQEEALMKLQHCKDQMAETHHLREHQGAYREKKLQDSIRKEDLRKAKFIEQS